MGHCDRMPSPDLGSLICCSLSTRNLDAARALLLLEECLPSKRMQGMRIRNGGMTSARTKMMKAADPEGRLTDDQRAVNGWSNMIRYHAARGDAQAVANAGAAMLMPSKRVSQQAGAMALTALEKGDFNTAAKAIQAAYNSFPDGESVRVNTAG